MPYSPFVYMNFSDKTHENVCIIVSKGGDISRGWPEGPLSNSYYIKV